MEKGNMRDLETVCAKGEDPRVERTKAHDVQDSMIRVHRMMSAPERIPSHDTFGRVLARSDPTPCEAIFLAWVQGISTTVKGVIERDGKTLRRSHDETAGKKPLHLVSAWVLEHPTNGATRCQL